MSMQAPGVQDKGDKDSPLSSKEVNKLHNKSDVDSSVGAQHHTLGTKKDQASDGAHTHDGKNSRKILAGVTLTGSRGGNAALASVISALVLLGATDATTV